MKSLFKNKQSFSLFMETQYLTLNYMTNSDRSIIDFNIYADFFKDLAKKLNKCTKKCQHFITGEKTPEYLYLFAPLELKMRQLKWYKPYSYTIPHLIRDLVPNVKLVITVRNPVERYSFLYRRWQTSIRCKQTSLVTLRDFVRVC